MTLRLREIATTLKTPRVGEMAKILGIHTAAGAALSVKHLIDVFIKEGTPREPTNLDFAPTGLNGTQLSWNDPGHGKWFAAQSFGFLFSNQGNGEVIKEGTISSTFFVIPSFDISSQEGQTFGLIVFAQSVREGANRISQSASLVERIPDSPGWCGGGSCDPSTSDCDDEDE